MKQNDKTLTTEAVAASSFPPADTGKRVKLVMFFYGLSFLLDWNAIINCFDFFILNVRIPFSCLTQIRCPISLRRWCFPFP